jgi:hypothetical protein
MKRRGFPARFPDLDAFRAALVEYRVDRSMALVGEDAQVRFSPSAAIAVYHDRTFRDPGAAKHGGEDRFLVIEAASGETLLEHREPWETHEYSARDRESETSDWRVVSETDRVDSWSVTDDALLLVFKTAGSYGPPRDHETPVVIPFPRRARA